MERQYKQLTTREKSIGEKAVTEVLVNVSKSVATKYATQYAIKGIDKLIAKGSKNIANKKAQAEAAKKAATAEHMKKATAYYNDNAKPGSLASKANMVKKFEEKNGK
jgi:YidC/Oxa1 family membrane protein insertase